MLHWSQRSSSGCTCHPWAEAAHPGATTPLALPSLPHAFQNNHSQRSHCQQHHSHFPQITSQPISALWCYRTDFSTPSFCSCAYVPLICRPAPPNVKHIHCFSFIQKTSWQSDAKLLLSSSVQIIKDELFFLSYSWFYPIASYWYRIYFLLEPYQMV